jgi:hypothetical protein
MRKTPVDHLNIRRDLSANRDFKSKNSTKYKLANDFLEVSLGLNAAFLSCPFLGASETIMIQSLLDLSRQSLVMATLQRPSVSYALLRLATEKFRDLKCILANPELSGLYLRGRDAAPKGVWRKTFRFFDEDETVLKLYNIASDWGVHSTTTLYDTASAVEPIGDANFVKLTKKQASKDAFVHVTMGLQLFLIKLNTALLKRIQAENDLEPSVSQALEAVLDTHYQQLLELKPKLDKLVKLQRK